MVKSGDSICVFSVKFCSSVIFKLKGGNVYTTSVFNICPNLFTTVVSLCINFKSFNGGIIIKSYIKFTKSNTIPISSGEI